MSIEQQGSLAFRLRHADRDWATNGREYNFPAFKVESITAWAKKKADRTIEFHVAGPFASELVFEGKVPSVDEKGLHVVITWSEKEVRLYLDAKPYSIVDLKKAKADA